MPRKTFAQYLLVGGLLIVRNRVQRVFLADGRRRGRRAERDYLFLPQDWI